MLAEQMEELPSSKVRKDPYVSILPFKPVCGSRGRNLRALIRSILLVFWEASFCFEALLNGSLLVIGHSSFIC